MSTPIFTLSCVRKSVQRAKAWANRRDEFGRINADAWAHRACHLAALVPTNERKRAEAAVTPVRKFLIK